ncbi:MAG: twin transmembrane helix small protein [Pseudomonadota bacterium]
MSGIFLALAIATALATVAVLTTGLIGMARGGEFNQRYGNRLMRWRVGLQAAAIVFLALAIFTR